MILRICFLYCVTTCRIRNFEVQNLNDTTFLEKTNNDQALVKLLATPSTVLSVYQTNTHMTSSQHCPSISPSCWIVQRTCGVRDNRILRFSCVILSVSKIFSVRQANTHTASSQHCSSVFPSCRMCSVRVAYVIIGSYPSLV